MTEVKHDVLSRVWTTPPESAAHVHEIPLHLIDPSFGNDRTIFDEQALRDLADSIRVNGLAQPVTVRPLESGRYQLIAGERRFRAHKLLEVETIKAIVRPMTDDEASAIMLVENTGRKDLDPIDEARAYQRRIGGGWDKKTLAEKAGVTQQHITNRLKLLDLRPDIQHLVRTGNMQIGYALILAESELDNNRQLIALKRLNQCPAPTPQWFRKECAELSTQQAQTDMFDNVLLFAAADFSAKVTKTEAAANLPPDPRKDKAPIAGATYQDVVKNQIAFWLEAADKWDRYGKAQQRDRCAAAAASLQSVLSIMPPHGGKARKAKQGNKTFYVYESPA